MQAVETVTAPTLTVKQSELKAAIAKVSKGVSGRSTLPILANILLDADGEYLSLSATNLEIAITVVIPAYVATPGKITIPAALLSSFVAALGPGQVSIAPLPQDVPGIRIQGGTAAANMRGTDASEFPRIPYIDDAKPLFTLDAVVLRGAIHETAPCAATDISHPVFTAICTHLTDTGIVFAASDTYRLAARHVPLPEAGTGEEYLIPARTLTTLTSILPDGEVTAYVTDKGQQVFFVAEGITVVSHLLEGKYPNYEAILPAHHSTRVIAPRAALLDALRATSVFDGDGTGTKTIKITVTPAESDLMPGTLTLDAKNDEFGDSEATVDATIDGPAITALYNSAY
ncbi:MAG: DNA polymerase III subunit beta, partial [Ktedonobacterales bacterium]|nr:DNA polymerase III subunit beta [Ktedonobacterales bacterium]